MHRPPVRCFHVPFGPSLCETPPCSTIYRVGLTVGDHCPGGRTPDHLLSYSTTGGLLRQTEPTHHVDSPASPTTIDAKSSGAHSHPAMLPNGTLTPIRAGTATSQPAMQSTVPMKQEKVPRGSESLQQALFSRAGRCYGATQWFRKQLKKNPFGRDGKLCYDARVGPILTS